MEIIVDRNIKNQFIWMSKYIGMREDFVQAGGGNTSVKLDETKMLIKSSGYSLSEMTLEEGYSIVNYKKLIQELKKINHNTEISMSDRLLQESIFMGKRPSIETFLHAVTEKFTIHSHPLLVNIFTARENGMQELKELFPNALLVEYYTPGIELAVAYYQTYQKEIKKEEQTFQIIFLKNHGLVVSGSTAEEAIDTHEKVIQILYKKLQYQDTINRNIFYLYKNLYPVNDGKIIYAVEDIKELKKLREDGIWNYTFAPDCIVYCGRNILQISEGDIIVQYKKYYKIYGHPVIIEFENQYYILAANIKKAKEIETVFRFCAKVCYENKEKCMNLLSEKEQNHLLNWDAEKYRQNIK